MSGSWTTGSLWDTGAMPGATDAVYIAQPGSYVIQLNQPSTQVDTLTVSASGALVQLTSFGGQLQARTVENDGSIVLGPANGLIGALNNIGTLTLAGDSSHAGGSIVNSGTINLNGSWSGLGGTLDNRGTMNVTAIATCGTFTNTGTLHLTGQLTVNPGCDFIQNGGTIEADAGLSIPWSSSTFYYNGGATYGLPIGVGNLVIGSGVGPANFGLNGGHLTGDVPSAVSLSISSAAMDSVTNRGTITWTASTPDPGTLTIGGGTGTLVNEGTFSTSCTAVSNTITGNMVNSVGGSMSLPSATVTGNVANSGGMTLNGGTIKGTLSNSGALTIASGATFHMGNGRIFGMTNGTLNVQGSLVFDGGSTANISGGTITGNPIQLFDCNLNFGGGTPGGTFRMVGNTATMSGDVPAGTTVKVELYWANEPDLTTGSFSNNGTIVFDGQYGAYLRCGGGSGTLTNNGAISFRKYAGASQTNQTSYFAQITGTVVNNGTIDTEPAAGSISSYIMADQLTNRGALSIYPNNGLYPTTLTQESGTINNQGSDKSTFGAYSLACATLNLNGGTINNLSGCNATTFNANGGTINNVGGITATTFNSNGGTISNVGGITTQTFNDNGGTITGPGSITVQTGFVFGPAAVPLQFVFTGSGDGAALPPTIPPGIDITFEVDQVAFGRVTAGDSPFTNSGTMHLPPGSRVDLQLPGVFNKRFMHNAGVISLDPGAQLDIEATKVVFDDGGTLQASASPGTLLWVHGSLDLSSANDWLTLVEQPGLTPTTIIRYSNMLTGQFDHVPDGVLVQYDTVT